MTEKNVYALLVAIDKYHPDSSVPHLAGCKNDVNRVNAFLQERIGDEYKPLLLADEQATKENIIAGFENHLGKAQVGDSILFYYSGHGSQSMTAMEFWHIEPDRLDETIVCYDSRLAGKSDLADKELAWLIDDLAKTGAHITAIMDCCHSGSGTREVDSRRMVTDGRDHSLDSYFFMEGIDPNTMMKKNTSSLSGWFDLPSGDHILLSACRSEQTAKEKVIDGERRGIFSHYFLETLQSSGPSITYRDAYMRTNALVRSSAAAQSPQLDTAGEVNLNQPFLGGAIKESPGYYTLAFHRDSTEGKDEGWHIDAGLATGIKKGLGDEATKLAIFPFDASAEDLDEVDKALAFVSVIETHPTRSKVELIPTDGFSLDKTTTYKAIVTEMPIEPLLVNFEGDEKAIELVRKALATAGPNGEPSFTVKEASEESSSFSVTAVKNQFVIQRKQDGYPLVEGTRNYLKESAETVVSRLEHIARWHYLLTLTNPHTKLDSSQVEIRIKVRQDDGSFVKVDETTDINLYSKGSKEGEEAMMEIRVANNSDRRLFFVFLIFGEAYDIASLTDGNQTNGKWLDPGEKFYPLEGEVPAWIEHHQWIRGITKLDHTMKLIVTTEENFASYYLQDELPITATIGQGTRAIGRRRDSTRITSDWFTIETAFTIHQPRGVRLATEGNTWSPDHIGISIEGHSGLTGTVELSALPEASRSTGNNTLPAILRDNPELFEPLELSASRGGSSGISVLDLADASGLETVTPDNPLKITLDSELGENESILALGKVGDYFVPLDIATRSVGGKVGLSIEHLPEPAVTTRSLKRAVRILFQKYANKYLGTPYTFPRLARIEVDSQGEVTYHTDESDIKTRVSEANNIGLYIHGIIGETKLMASSSRTDWLKLENEVPGLSDSHDLLLAFDYENINTPIEDVAALLKEKLAAVGLKSGHEKTFNIIAHSMGGLVSRWFVEYLGGNKVVNHLVMLGTPNGGSPLPQLQDWLMGALTIGLNALSITAWPITLLNAVIAGIEKVDINLDQMHPDSDFLKNLSRSPDPEIPYTIIAGNTSMLPGAVGTPDEPGIIPMIWSRFKAENRKNALMDFAFLLHPNDIAVSVESIQNLPKDWEETIPAVHEIPSDHMSYFILEEGLKPLYDALSNRQ